MLSRDRWAPVEMTLKEFLSRFVAPSLRDAGFRKIRPSTWTVTSPDRSVVLVMVRGRNYPYGPGFFIEWAPIPAALRDYHSRYDDAAPPKYEWGMFRARYAPRGNRYVNIGGLWSPATPIDEYGEVPATPSEMQEFGNEVARALREDAIPRWLRALDRDYLAEGSDPDLSRPRAVAMNGPHLLPLFLHIDDGDPDELRALMNRQAAPIRRDDPNMQRFSAEQLDDFQRHKDEFNVKVLGFLADRLAARTATGAADPA